MNADEIPPTDLSSYFFGLRECGPATPVKLFRIVQAFALKAKLGGMALSMDTGKEDGAKNFHLFGMTQFYKRYRQQLDRYNRARTALARGVPVTNPKDMVCCCYYELLDTMTDQEKLRNPCNLMLDIEFYHGCNGDSPTFEERKGMFLGIIETLLNTLYGIANASQTWIINESDASNNKKISRHLVIHLADNFMFYNWFHVGAFMRRVYLLSMKLYGHPQSNPLFVRKTPNDPYPEPFSDATIYTSRRNIRVIGSTKFGQDRPLRYVSEIRNEQPVVLGLDDITQDIFMGSLIQNAYKKDETKIRMLECREFYNGFARSTTSVPCMQKNGSYVVSVADIEDDGSYHEPFVAGGIVGADFINKMDKSISITQDSMSSIDFSKCSESITSIACYLQEILRKAFPNVLFHNSPKHSEFTWSFRTYSAHCPIAGRVHNSNNQNYSIRLAYLDKETDSWKVIDRPKIRVYCFSNSCKSSNFSVDLPEMDQKVKDIMEATINGCRDSNVVTIGDLFKPLCRL